MVNLEWYRPLQLGTLTEDSVRQAFLASLIDSNRDTSFFVDWKKVRQNVESQRRALEKLTVVRGNRSPLEELQRILVDSPEVARVIPLLVAWRAKTGKVLRESPTGVLRSESFDFSGLRHLSDTEARAMADFAKASGGLQVLEETSDLGAYLLGIEAGMDTNARKNRSGKFMEAHVEPHIQRACAINPSWRLFDHKTFADVQKTGLKVPAGLLEREFDYAIVGPEKPLSIEVNYYEKEGSKPQEIVDSYIQRSHELKAAGWEFVWITEGPCWKGDTPQIRKAFPVLSAILNLDFCRRGVLDQVLGATEPQLLHSLSQAKSTEDAPEARRSGLDSW